MHESNAGNTNEYLLLDIPYLSTIKGIFLSEISDRSRFLATPILLKKYKVSSSSSYYYYYYSEFDDELTAPYSTLAFKDPFTLCGKALHLILWPLLPLLVEYWVKILS